MQPGVDDLIDGTDDKPFYQSHVEVLAHKPLILAAFHNLGDQVQIHLRHLPDLFLTHAAESARLGLVKNCQVSIPLKLFQVPLDQPAQFVPRVIPLVHCLPEPAENLLGFILEEVHHDIFFIFEIEIDGAVGHALAQRVAVRLAARVFRVGILLYGQPPSLPRPAPASPARCT